MENQLDPHERVASESAEFSGLQPWQVRENSEFYRRMDSYFSERAAYEAALSAWNPTQGAMPQPPAKPFHGPTPRRPPHRVEGWRIARARGDETAAPPSRGRPRKRIAVALEPEALAALQRLCAAAGVDVETFVNRAITELAMGRAAIVVRP